MTLQGGSLLVLYPRTDHGSCIAFYGHAVGVAVLRTAVKETRCISGCDRVGNQSRRRMVLDVSVTCGVAAMITLSAKQTARRRPCDVTVIDMWSTRRSCALYRVFTQWQIVVKFEFIVCRNIGCDARLEGRTAARFRIQVALMWLCRVVGDLRRFRVAYCLTRQGAGTLSPQDVRNTASHRVRPQSPFAPPAPLVRMRNAQLAVCLAARCLALQNTRCLAWKFW